MTVSIVGMSAGIIKHSLSHIHTTWEIVLNLQGEGVTQIAGREYAFRPGTIICLPPGTPHTKLSDGGFSDIYIQVEHLDVQEAVGGNGVVVLEDDASGSFESLIHMAYRAFHGKEANYQSLVDALFEAMHQLLRAWVARRPQEIDVERVKNRLIASFTDPTFSIADLTADTPYCGDHLRRRFKRETGMTPVECLTDLRVNFAKKLMIENASLNHSIAEIAVMSGYEDSRYFSRVFKKNTGVTPQEYLHNLAGHR